MVGDAHTFGEVLPRIAAAGGEGHLCGECQTTLEPWEGQPAPRLYGFTARHIAHALVRVAHGGAYRDVAAEVRAMAGRSLDTTRGRKGGANGKKALAPATRHGQLVSDWVDTFSPVIWKAYAPAVIAPWLLLDDTDFRYSASGQPRGSRAFAVLAVMDQGPTTAARVVAIESSMTTSAATWQRLLRRLPPTATGSGPEVIVGDGGAPLNAAGTIWPTDTVLRRCEWHWRRNIIDTLPAAVRKDTGDDIHHLLRRAFITTAGWDELTALVAARQARTSEPGQTYNLATKVLNSLDAEVRTALATRPTDVGPRSTGPLEQVFNDVRNKLGDRTHGMTNKRRADALLKLLAAAHNGWVDEDTWTRILREHLTTRRGLAAEQRRHTDTKSAPSLG